MDNVSRIVRRFRRDERGSIAILFGLSAIILVTIAGVAIDSSRAYNVSFKLQTGLDAAALAAAKLLDDANATTDQFQETGEAFFKTYLDSLAINGVTATNIQVTPNYSDSSVTVSADVKIKTFFGAVSDVKTFDYTPSSTVIFKPKKIELALVLDITGSMCDSPPSSASNACSSGAKIDALKAAAKDVVQQLSATNPAANSIKVSVVPYSASVNLGSRANSLTAGLSTDGCLVERTGAAAFDDLGPASLFPIATQAVYPAYSCPEPDVLGLTDIADSTKRATVTNKIDGLKAIGGTAGHIGLAWGWYSVSPNWSSFWPSNSSPRPFDPDRVIKSVVLMTDGMFNTSYYNGGELHAWPSPSSSNSSVPGTSGYQALELCKEMRESDKDIKIYTVGFQTPSEAEDLLKQCSGADNFYAASNAGELSAAFKDIAKRLTSIRVSS